jgi:hypothetical protein
MVPQSLVHQLNFLASEFGVEAFLGAGFAEEALEFFQRGTF